MALARIRKGDTVVVLTGKDEGKRGTVRQVLPKEGKAIVEGVNVAKRHYKPGRRAGQQVGSIVELELPIDLAKLAPVDPKDGKPTRVRVSTLGDGSKVRIGVRSGEQIGKE